MTRITHLMFLHHLTYVSSTYACFMKVNTCPDTEKRWRERSSEYKCKPELNYMCLMNINMTLAETCIHERIVDPKRSGCPVLAFCDEDIGPVIDNEFMQCKEGVRGCPPINHSGYNLTEMFKYPGCFKISLDSGKPSSIQKDNLLSKIILPSVLVPIAVIMILCLVRLVKKRRKEGMSIQEAMCVCYECRSACSKNDKKSQKKSYSSVQQIDDTFEEDAECTYLKELPPKELQQGDVVAELHTRLKKKAGPIVATKPKVLRKTPGSRSSLTTNQLDKSSSEQTVSMDLQPVSSAYIRRRPRDEQMADSNSQISLPDNTISVVDSSSYSFKNVSVPSEVQKYLEEVDYKPELSTLNSSTMRLLSEAPKAIGLVGRLHFIASLTSFEIGISSEEGRELSMHASAVGKNCKECFDVAKDNFESIIYSMSVVNERLSTLYSTMTGDFHDCRSETNSTIIIDSIIENVDECIEFCNGTETMFRKLREYVEPFDCSLQSAKKKIDDKYQSSPIGKTDYHLNLVNSSLKNMSELIGRTTLLFEELGNHWERITDFFKSMRLFLTGTVKKDVAFYLRSLSSGQIDSYGQGTLQMVSMKGNKSLPSEILNQLSAKAKYVSIVSAFYVFVSREIFAKCLQIITRSLYVKEQMTLTEIESSMERLQKVCTDAEDHVIYLCETIEQLVKR